MDDAFSSVAGQREARSDGWSNHSINERARRLFGGVQITEVVHDGSVSDLRVCASRRDSSGDSVWVLILALEGRSVLTLGEADKTLEPGDLLLVGPGAPLSREVRGPCREIVVNLPRALLQPRLSLSQPFTPCLIDGRSGLGQVLLELIRSLLTAPGPFCEREQTGIRDALVHLIMAAASRDYEERFSRCGPPTAFSRQWTLLQESIETFLPDPALSPATVAAVHRISTRHLHRLFKQAGTSFGSYVRGRRLDHCRCDLADPRFEELPLTEIAYRWGFSDSSHFSRSFKAAFGCTAREFRLRELDAQHDRPGLFVRSRSTAGGARERRQGEAVAIISPPRNGEDGNGSGGTTGAPGADQGPLS